MRPGAVPVSRCLPSRPRRQTAHVDSEITGLPHRLVGAVQNVLLFLSVMVQGTVEPPAPFTLSSIQQAGIVKWRLPSTDDGETGYLLLHVERVSQSPNAVKCDAAKGTFRVAAPLSV